MAVVEKGSRHEGAVAVRVGGRGGRCNEDEEWQTEEVRVIVERQW